MRKMCRRKHYPLVNTIATAIEGAAIISDGELIKRQIVESQALSDMVNGHAGIYAWRELVDVVNIAETMASKGLGTEAIECVNIAHEALIEAAKRYESTKRMGLSANGIEALRNVFDYHNLQRTSISRSAYQEYINLTARRLRSNHKDAVTL
jgi:hypothetical protein